MFLRFLEDRLDDREPLLPFLLLPRRRWPLGPCPELSELELDSSEEEGSSSESESEACFLCFRFFFFLLRRFWREDFFFPWSSGLLVDPELLLVLLWELDESPSPWWGSPWRAVRVVLGNGRPRLRRSVSEIGGPET